MLICDNCHTALEEDELQPIREDHGEVFDHCPYCGGDSFTEAECCTECGECFPIEAMKNGLCPECQLETLTEFRRYLSNLSDEQKEFLNSAFDGERFSA